MSSSSSQEDQSEPHWQEASPIPLPQDAEEGGTESAADTMIRHQAELERMAGMDFGDEYDEDEDEDDDFHE